MERCDFAAIAAIINHYISEDKELNQLDFVYLLFSDFITSHIEEDVDFDNGLVCRWMNGIARVSPRITSHYMDSKNKQNLIDNIQQQMIPMMYDSGMACQKIYDLILYDSDISEKQKQKLIEYYPCKDTSDEANLIAEALCFGMTRTFVKKTTENKKLLSSGNFSPTISDFIMEGDVSKPCRYFCGREKEIEQLHELLVKERKVFLHGIAGIGKSELVKAYTKKYKKSYQNILYIAYSGSLKQDIIDLDFVDDLQEDSEEERFRKHNRFLRSLKEDTLLIIDNFNVTAEKDTLLPIVMKYRCRVVFTTRSRFDNYICMQLDEITEIETLFQLMSCYYSCAEKYRSILLQIIETIHSHTLAVELAARLLEKGILEPSDLLLKLQSEKAAPNISDKIGITKDGKAIKNTYYGHIHLLFSLYQLSEQEQNVMCNVAMIPFTGISAKLFAKWLKLSNLNTVNDLIEMGFIVPKSGQAIALHPMIQEIAVADTKPSIQKCQILCQSLQEICLLHGKDVAYHKIMFQTIENLISLAEKDDMVYYLCFLEDVFPYMEKYHYEIGMKTVLNEIHQILDMPFGKIKDKTLYLDYCAACEKKTDKAISLEKKALSLLTKINVDNAHLAANIHANLGALYRETGQTTFAKKHMEKGITILEQYNLTYSNDSIAQICNYAILLMELGEAERGLTALRKLARIVKNYNLEFSSDYAVIQEAMANICLVQGNISEATRHFKKAIQIYKIVWENEPELIEAKYQEIQLLYPQVGIVMAKLTLS